MNDLPPDAALVALSLATALVGTLGGVGGAIILVPVLILLGADPRIAAPLGILSVAAGSLAAAPRQLREGVVHHRLGVTLEITASAGAILGAVLGDVVPGSVLSRFLAAVAIVSAVAGARRKGIRNRPDVTFAEEAPGEWPGTLGGSYRLGEEIVPYQARNVPLGLAAMSGAGLVAGLAGVGGGFIKTPVMSEVMKVPVKVASATTTFTAGITSSASLLVFAGQGRVDYRAGAAVVAGGLVGGVLGAAVQARLDPQVARKVLSALLVFIGVLLAVRG
ncbi:MAG: sulfite exporter TauE/SafE family protein [Acidimicrobiales bacterium]|nr:sulfite exporter TauE/SafE family protein [Acidimicrobiales bacterium]